MIQRRSSLRNTTTRKETGRQTPALRRELQSSVGLLSCALLVFGCGKSDSPGAGEPGSGGSSATGGSAEMGGGTPGAGGGLGTGGSEVGPIEDCTASLVEGRLVHGEASPLVLKDPTCGRLSYGLYANHGQDNAVHLLPDFSFAGYKKGGVAIPDAPVKRTLSPQAGDNRAAIQAALDEVSALPLGSDGFRGAVLLTKGSYNVGGSLNINASGVVLRGEGQGTDGTVLIATSATQHDLIQISGSGDDLREIPGTRIAITSPYVAVGARSFEVEDASAFAVGDTIAVVRTPNQAWTDALEVTQWGWTPASYEIDHERSITAIEGQRITVDMPLVDTMESAYGGGEVFLADTSSRIRQCGVEDLRLDSEYAGPEDENHGWSAISLTRVQDSFVRRVTAVHFGYAAVTFEGGSSFNTVEEVAQLDPISQVTGGRRYSFNVSGGVGNLFQRCFAREGRHNFVTGARVTGPHVWLDSLAVSSSNDEGPHHRWSVGLLFDNTQAAIFNAQNRAESGTGHGWAGAQTLFWNIIAETRITSDAPLGAMNWVVGGTGIQADSTITPEAPEAWWESHGSFVSPRSLYLAQLEDRLGSAAVAAVTTEEQRSGAIYDRLNGWAGEGTLADATPEAPLTCDGILAGDACCPSSCGQCGGPGCGSAPGGSGSCCAGTVSENSPSCTSNPPPCVMP